MITRMRTPEEHADYGRYLVGHSHVAELRQRLGITRSAMAQLLHMAPLTYIRCEDEPGTADRMWTSTAERLGRFAYLAEKTLTDLLNEGVDLADLTPIHVLATSHGMPLELLVQLYRQGAIHAEDLGILGLWVHKDDIHYIREAV